MRTPSKLDTRPFTCTRPAWISRSPSRREATPASARNFCRRTPRSRSGVVSVVSPLVVVFIVFERRLPVAVIVVLFERPRAVARLRALYREGLRGPRGGRTRQKAPELRCVRQVLKR